MWLSYLKVAASPGELTYDLAVDASGEGQPSRRAAGLELLSTVTESGPGRGISGTGVLMVLAGAGVLAAALAAGGLVGRRTR